MSLNNLKERPNSAGAEVINICNADCSFCGYGKGKDGKAADPRVKQKIDIELQLEIFGEKTPKDLWCEDLDEFEKRNGEWRISKRMYILDWKKSYTDLSQGAILEGGTLHTPDISKPGHELYRSM